MCSTVYDLSCVGMFDVLQVHDVLVIEWIV